MVVISKRATQQAIHFISKAKPFIFVTVKILAAIRFTNERKSQKRLAKTKKTEPIKTEEISNSGITSHSKRLTMAKLVFITLQLLLTLAIANTHFASADQKLQSKKLCSQCSGCNVKQCPASESYPHMTAWDNSLIAGALQSDYVPAYDRGVYSVPDIKGGTSKTFNSYYGWESTSGSASGFHRYNYMDKCSMGQSYLTVDEHGKVGLRSLSSLKSLAQADWKSINPPPGENHREYRFWVSRSTGKCLTVFGGNTNKRVVGVAECKLDGSNPYQLFAFRFHYHKAFCCCGLHNE